MLRRCKWMVALALALVATGGASASADTITVTSGPDPTEDVPLPVSVSWTSGSTDQYAFVTIKPAGALTCAASYAADDSTSEDLIWRWTGSVAGTHTGSATQWTPGLYVLCAYLQSTSSAAVPAAVSGPVPVTVRSARAAVSLTVTPHADARHRVAVSAAVTSELRRFVYVTVRPIAARGCETRYVGATPSVLMIESGEGTWAVNKDYTAPDSGTFRLCAYVQERVDDAPEATASTTFVVGPDPCIAARAKLRVARKAVKKAESAVARSRKRSQRYRRAVRVRAAERRKLDRARAAVADAC